MKCPNCEEMLVMSERQGVEIDYCPKCLGIWLDRGELDKILEKSMNVTGYSEERSYKGDYDNDDGPYTSKQKGFDQEEGQQKGRRRRGGFLGDFFDFD